MRTLQCTPQDVLRGRPCTFDDYLQPVETTLRLENRLTDPPRVPGAARDGAVTLGAWKEMQARGESGVYTAPLSR